MASMDTQSRQPPGAEPPASATEPVIRSPYWRLVRAVRAVADADPAQIEAATRQFGQSRRYLTPVAWAAGSIVLLVRGIKRTFTAQFIDPLGRPAMPPVIGGSSMRPTLRSLAVGLTCTGRWISTGR